MDSAVKAALNVFGLSQVPKTQAELKAVYRKHVKKAHPDRYGGEADAKPFQRVHKANEVLLNAIEMASVPKVAVKFGEGNPQSAKVVRRVIVEDTLSNYVVALHWFQGMLIKIEQGEWQEIEKPESFVQDEIRVIFV